MIHPERQDKSEDCRDNSGKLVVIDIKCKTFPNPFSVIAHWEPPDRYEGKTIVNMVIQTVLNKNWAEVARSLVVVVVVVVVLTTSFSGTNIHLSSL